MRKHFGFLLVPVLLGGILAAPSPATACIEHVTCPGDPLHDPVPDLADVTKTVTAITNKVNNPNLVKRLAFSAVAYPAKYLRHSGGFAAGPPGVPNAMPAASAGAAASSGCEPYPPNAASCHEWWAAARWKSPPDGGSCCTYQIEWKIIFWTDRNNQRVTSMYVSCRDHPQNGWEKETNCSTSWEPYANPTVGWHAHYQYAVNPCPWSPGRRDTDDITATVRASNRAITGTWNRYEKPIYC